MKFTKEIKIALVSIFGIVVLFFGLQFLKGLSVFSSDNAMYVAFTDATGLSVSSPVYANGYRVGVVKALDYDYDPHGKIIAEVGLNKEMRVPVGSRAELASDLLGNIKINLVLGDDPLHMIAVGDTISRADALMEARPEYLNPNQEKLASYNQGWNNAIEMYYRQIAELSSVEPTVEKG